MKTGREKVGNILVYLQVLIIILVIILIVNLVTTGK